MLDDAVAGARLRAARETAGLTLGQLAKRVPYSKALLGHVERGVRHTSPDLIEAYEKVCGPVTTDPISFVEVLGRADVGRRSFLLKVVYSAALSATALVTVKPSHLARLIALDDSTLVGMEEVEAVRGVVDALLKLDETRGGGRGRTVVGEFLSTDIATMLRARFATGEVRAAAFSAASEAAYLAGFKAHDAGLDAIAQRYFLASLGLARESGVPGQTGMVYRILALHAGDVQQPRYSVDLAERALSEVKDQSPDTRILFTVALARCHAESGDRAAARRVLHSAGARLDASEVTTELPRWARLWCPNKGSANRQLAKTFVALGDLAEAERYHYRSAQIWDPTTHRRIHALTTAETGLIRWKLGRHEDAAALWRPALTVLAGVDSDRSRKVIARIGKVAPELVGTHNGRTRKG